MIKQETLQNLLDTRRDLENRLMDLTPGQDPAKVQQYRDLSRRRDQVFITINQVIASQFKEVVNPEVDKLLKSLEAETKSLKGWAETFDTINDVISTTDKILQVALKVIAAVA
jgi:hypothetical protein